MSVNVRRVLGLDLSITATGVCFTTADGDAHTMTIKTRDKDGQRRLLVIRQAIRELAPGAELALIEAPTPRSASSVVSGMVHGVVRAELLDLGIPYGTLMPASLKKYATGKGTGDKVPMAVAALKRAEKEFADDNQCDAWWLWVAATDKLGFPAVSLPQLHRESLTKIKMEG